MNQRRKQLLGLGFMLAVILFFSLSTTTQITYTTLGG